VARGLHHARVHAGVVVGAVGGPAEQRNQFPETVEHRDVGCPLPKVTDHGEEVPGILGLRVPEPVEVAQQRRRRAEVE